MHITILDDYFDTVRTLRHEEVLKRPDGEIVHTFDLTMDGDG